MTSFYYYDRCRITKEIAIHLNPDHYLNPAAIIKFKYVSDRKSNTPNFSL